MSTDDVDLVWRHIYELGLLIKNENSSSETISSEIPTGRASNSIVDELLVSDDEEPLRTRQDAPEDQFQSERQRFVAELQGPGTSERYPGVLCLSLGTTPESL